MDLTFEFDKDTKNTRRYVEMTEDGVPAVGYLYVQKWALRDLGNPERITVTITAEGEARVEVPKTRTRTKATK